jgi:hypothetical protein
VQEGDNMQDPKQQSLYFAGPLNMNRVTKKADTVMGSELAIDEFEFQALDMLVSREGEALTFDFLYGAVWDAGDGTDRRETALTGLSNLVKLVNEAGSDFMWIEYTPGSGYTFLTHWGHNWHKQMNKPPYLPADKALPERRVSRRRVGVGFAVTAAAAAVVVALGLSLMSLWPEPAIDEYTIFDEQVPLAAADFLISIEFPDINKVEVCADTGSIAPTLYNPEDNSGWFIFEIALADTSEVIFVSELTAPGAFIENIALTMPLPEGEYEAVLLIRAYESGSPLETGFSLMEISIVVT